MGEGGARGGSNVEAGKREDIFHRWPAARVLLNFCRCLRAAASQSHRKNANHEKHPVDNKRGTFVAGDGVRTVLEPERKVPASTQSAAWASQRVKHDTRLAELRASVNHSHGIGASPDRPQHGQGQRHLRFLWHGKLRRERVHEDGKAHASGVPR